MLSGSGHADRLARRMPGTDASFRQEGSESNVDVALAHEGITVQIARMLVRFAQNLANFSLERPAKFSRNPEDA
jgi:hypothetical protein